MHRLQAIEDEVRASDGVEDTGSPDPRLTSDERRRSLARKLRDQLPTERGVFGVEPLGTELIRERRDLLDHMPESGWNARILDHQATAAAYSDDVGRRWSTR
jgi:hypothetical protein